MPARCEDEDVFTRLTTTARTAVLRAGVRAQAERSDETSCSAWSTRAASAPWRWARTPTRRGGGWPRLPSAGRRRRAAEPEPIA
ncbi:hypothetical protein ACOBQX_10160 [Actinokineospora sp. G85]|uniref:hypothetical protein n=1 Tax=Actinokineospora sp. G85 TaxID=3406626 RepID=UPI003C772348